MLLADLGAEVVKVEGPRGDDTRSWVPPVHDGVSTYFLGINRNKRSVVLDFADESDAVLARELARRADIVIENFRPGGLAKYGLDYDSVAAANPRVLYASISGFGSGEQGRALPGYDLIVQAISGLMSLTGPADGEPYRAGISVFDVMAGLHATIGLLAALHRRARDRSRPARRGQPPVVRPVGDGQPHQRLRRRRRRAYRMGNSHPSLFPYEPLPCSDGELHRHGGQRPAVPQARGGPGRPGAGRRPAVRSQPGSHRPTGRAAPAPRRTAVDPDHHGVVPRHHRGRDPLRADQHRRPGRRVRRGASASTRSSTSGRPGRRSAASATPSRCPRVRPPTGSRRLPSTSTGPRSAAGWPRRRPS